MRQSDKKNNGGDCFSDSSKFSRRILAWDIRWSHGTFDTRYTSFQSRLCANSVLHLLSRLVLFRKFFFVRVPCSRRVRLLLFGEFRSSSVGVIPDRNSFRSRVFLMDGSSFHWEGEGATGGSVARG